jgi:hypothetical protein
MIIIIIIIIKGKVGWGGHDFHQNFKRILGAVSYLLFLLTMGRFRPLFIP